MVADIAMIRASGPRIYRKMFLPGEVLTVATVVAAIVAVDTEDVGALAAIAKVAIEMTAVVENVEAMVGATAKLDVGVELGAGVDVWARRRVWSLRVREDSRVSSFRGSKTVHIQWRYRGQWQQAKIHKTTPG